MKVGGNKFWMNVHTEEVSNYTKWRFLQYDVGGQRKKREQLKIEL